jgi:hypothetical protein
MTRLRCYSVGDAKNLLADAPASLRSVARNARTVQIKDERRYQEDWLSSVVDSKHNVCNCVQFRFSITAINEVKYC